MPNDKVTKGIENKKPYLNLVVKYTALTANKILKNFTSPAFIYINDALTAGNVTISALVKMQFMFFFILRHDTTKHEARERYNPANKPFIHGMLYTPLIDV